MHHPIFAKFEAEHVTKFLDHAHKHDIEDSRFRSGGRWFRLVYVLIGVVIFVFLTLFLLPDQSVFSCVRPAWASPGGAACAEHAKSSTGPAGGTVS